MEISFVTRRLAVGSAIATIEDAERLVYARGITHVLNLRHDFDDWLILQRVMDLNSYCWNPSCDGANSRPKPPHWFEESIRFAMGVFERPRAKLFVHCNGGVSRSPATCFAILLALGVEEREADRMVFAARPQYDRYYSVCAERAVRLRWCD